MQRASHFGRSRFERVVVEVLTCIPEPDHRYCARRDGAKDGARTDLIGEDVGIVEHRSALRRIDA